MKDKNAVKMGTLIILTSCIIFTGFWFAFNPDTDNQIFGFAVLSIIFSMMFSSIFFLIIFSLREYRAENKKID